MRKTLFLVAVGLTALAAAGWSLVLSSPPAWQQEAVAVLRRFQAALQDNDRAQLRQTLSWESLQYLDALPRHRDGRRLPLELVAASRNHGRVELVVRDPNAEAPAEHGRFVLVREDGRWHVDLVETAGANKREIPLPGPAYRLVPKQLTPREIEAAQRQVGGRGPG
jgi:hypothetical protein